MREVFLECKDISFSYHSLKGETIALSHMNFNVYKGEFLAVVGPSGCGKSTLLSLIAGLLQPEAGGITIHSQAQPRIGYMLQQDNLLEWRTIQKNVLLGLEINHTLSPRKEAIANQLLEDYGLYSFKDKRPSELSGGMKQRAALIRTMVMEPDLLLLDEPFSSLDYQSRLVVSADIGRIIRNFMTTTILITHDLSEAISMADRILILSKRPATIKKELPIQLTLTDDSILAPRNAVEFKEYFAILWKEISEEYDT